MNNPVMTVEARRVYVSTPYGHPVVAKLKSLDSHWDADSKRWWVGIAKKGEVEKILAEALAAPASEAIEDLSSARISAKVTYEGRQYYVIASTADRARLTTLNDKIAFWADKSKCELIRKYEPRTNTFRGRTTTEYTTVGSLRRFVESQKEGESKGLQKCTECGVRSNRLVADLEDGLMKCRKCCDIEPD